MKSGNFKFLEPSGPLHAWKGTDLPYTICFGEWNCAMYVLTPREKFRGYVSLKYWNMDFPVHEEEQILLITFSPT